MVLGEGQRGPIWFTYLMTFQKTYPPDDLYFYWRTGLSALSHLQTHALKWDKTKLCPEVFC